MVIIFSSGSSPHPRGALDPSSEALARIRIIPASAGSTSAVSACSWLPGDHPRIRGEHDGFQCILTTREGSSPHPRGARSAHPCSWYRPGIIPASAGSTLRNPYNFNSVAGKILNFHSVCIQQLPQSKRLKDLSANSHSCGKPHLRCMNYFIENVFTDKSQTLKSINLAAV